MNSFKLMLVFVICFGFACSKEDNNDQLLQPSESKLENDGIMKQKVIYYATWESWGRAARECDGMGLCRFEDCWGCEPGVSSLGGVIVLDDINQIFTLTIELDDSDSLQLDAINGSLPLIIDEDISDNDPLPAEYRKLTLAAGSYPYKSEIGDFGGYEIPIIVE